MESGTAMKRWIVGLALAVTLGGAAACGDPVDTDVTPIKFDGVVREFALPGPSTWLIERMDDPSIAYYPTNLPAQYHVEGAELDIEAVLVNDEIIYERNLIEILSITVISLP